jgi:hypothetical protein
MIRKELILKLQENGPKIVNMIVVKHDEGLYHLDKLYGGRFIDVVNLKGLGQASASFGDPRIVHVSKTLNELGFNTEIYGGEADLYINEYDTEVKGSFRRHTDTYGQVQSGNYSIKHNGRLHIFLKAKIDVNNIKVVSLRLEIYFAPSDAFESKSGKSGKTNRSIFNEKKAETIGIWEAINHSEENHQTRFF